jgi:hypothetical protein
MHYQHSAEYQNLKIKALQKSKAIEQGTYETPSTDKALRSDDSPKFFSNTEVIKANDDFYSKDKTNSIY